MLMGDIGLVGVVGGAVVGVAAARFLVLLRCISVASSLCLCFLLARPGVHQDE